ncbi:hypothetical protein Q5752_000439 [Cryptotrichosporon argae]
MASKRKRTTSPASVSDASSTASARVVQAEAGSSKRARDDGHGSVRVTFELVGTGQTVKRALDADATFEETVFGVARELGVSIMRLKFAHVRAFDAEVEIYDDFDFDAFVRRATSTRAPQLVRVYPNYTHASLATAQAAFASPASAPAPTPFLPQGTASTVSSPAPSAAGSDSPRSIMRGPTSPRSEKRVQLEVPKKGEGSRRPKKSKKKTDDAGVADVAANGAELSSNAGPPHASASATPRAASLVQCPTPLAPLASTPPTVASKYKPTRPSPLSQTVDTGSVSGDDADSVASSSLAPSVRGDMQVAPSPFAAPRAGAPAATLVTPTATPQPTKGKGKGNAQVHGAIADAAPAPPLSPNSKKADRARKIRQKRKDAQDAAAQAALVSAAGPSHVPPPGEAGSSTAALPVVTKPKKAKKDRTASASAAPAPALPPRPLPKSQQIIAEFKADSARRSAELLAAAMRASRSGSPSAPTRPPAVQAASGTAGSAPGSATASPALAASTVSLHPATGNAEQSPAVATAVTADAAASAPATPAAMKKAKAGRKSSAGETPVTTTEPLVPTPPASSSSPADEPTASVEPAAVTPAPRKKTPASKKKEAGAAADGKAVTLAPAAAEAATAASAEEVTTPATPCQPTETTPAAKKKRGRPSKSDPIVESDSPSPAPTAPVDVASNAPVTPVTVSTPGPSTAPATSTPKSAKSVGRPRKSDLATPPSETTTRTLSGSAIQEQKARLNARTQCKICGQVADHLQKDCSIVKGGADALRARLGQVQTSLVAVSGNSEEDDELRSRIEAEEKSVRMWLKRVENIGAKVKGTATPVRAAAASPATGSGSLWVPGTPATPAAEAGNAVAASSTETRVPPSPLAAAAVTWSAPRTAHADADDADGESSASDSDEAEDEEEDVNSSRPAADGQAGATKPPIYLKALARPRRPGSMSGLSVSDAVIETGESSESSSDEPNSSSDDDGSGSDSSDDDDDTASTTSLPADTDPEELARRFMSRPLSQKEKRAARLSAAAMLPITNGEDGDGEDDDDDAEDDEVDVRHTQRSARRGSGSSIGDFEEGSGADDGGMAVDDDIEAEDAVMDVNPAPAPASQAHVGESSAERHAEAETEHAAQLEPSSSLHQVPAPIANGFSTLVESESVETPGDAALRSVIEEEEPSLHDAHSAQRSPARTRFAATQRSSQSVAGGASPAESAGAAPPASPPRRRTRSQSREPASQSQAQSQRSVPPSPARSGRTTRSSSKEVTSPKAGTVELGARVRGGRAVRGRGRAGAASSQGRVDSIAEADEPQTPEPRHADVDRSSQIVELASSPPARPNGQPLFLEASQIPETQTQDYRGLLVPETPSDGAPSLSLSQRRRLAPTSPIAEADEDEAGGEGEGGDGPADDDEPRAGGASDSDPNGDDDDDARTHPPPASLPLPTLPRPAARAPASQPTSFPTLSSLSADVLRTGRAAFGSLAALANGHAHAHGNSAGNGTPGKHAPAHGSQARASLAHPHDDSSSDDASSDDDVPAARKGRTAGARKRESSASQGPRGW